MRSSSIAWTFVGSRRRRRDGRPRACRDRHRALEDVRGDRLGGRSCPRPPAEVDLRGGEWSVAMAEASAPIGEGGGVSRSSGPRPRSPGRSTRRRARARTGEAVAGTSPVVSSRSATSSVTGFGAMAPAGASARPRSPRRLSLHRRCGSSNSTRPSAAIKKRARTGTNGVRGDRAPQRVRGRDAACLNGALGGNIGLGPIPRRGIDD